MTKLFSALALLALATPALPCPCEEGAKTTSASHANAKPAVASSKGTMKKSTLKEKAAPAAKPAAVTD